MFFKESNHFIEKRGHDVVPNISCHEQFWNKSALSIAVLGICNICYYSSLLSEQISHNLDCYIIPYFLPLEHTSFFKTLKLVNMLVSSSQTTQHFLCFMLSSIVTAKCSPKLWSFSCYDSISWSNGSTQFKISSVSHLYCLIFAILYHQYLHTYSKRFFHLLTWSPRCQKILVNTIS